jgi:hypothetical protein
MAAGASGGPAVLLAAGGGANPNSYPVFAYGIFSTENGISRKRPGNAINRFRSRIRYLLSRFRRFSFCPANTKTVGKNENGTGFFGPIFITVDDEMIKIRF